MKDGELAESCVWLALLIMLIVAVVFLPGCQSGQKATRAGQERFRQNVSACTQAIRAGDLADAKALLAKADDDARSFDQKRKTQSLGGLIDGAEALMDGNAQLARAKWSQIEDPLLGREVRVKANLIGMDVPLISTEAEQDKESN